jgi:hypothetical protein
VHTAANEQKLFNVGLGLADVLFLCMILISIAGLLYKWLG